MPLKLSCLASDPLEATFDLLVLGVFTHESPASVAPLEEADRALHGALGRVMKRMEFTGKRDQVVEIETLGQLKAQRLCVLGLGDASAFTQADACLVASKAARTAQAARATSLALALPMGSSVEVMRALGEGLVFGAYRFTKYLTGDRLPKAELTKASVLVPKKPGATKPMRAALDLGQRIGESVCITRDLVNEPPNELTPPALAQVAQQMARSKKLACKVYGKKELEKMGMKLMLAVAQGSAHEPRLVHLTYKPTKPTKKRLVLVGKGLTFDSGGLCIKPAAGMGEMKSDMAGAGNVVGLLAAIAELAPAVEVHGIIAAAENMPDGNAYRPGDVFGSLDGKTVEIVNTDAEGRLVLADALAFARKLEPTVLVCNATLTGACVVALGQRCTGFYATTDALAETVRAAARDTGEQFWQMPLLEDLREQLKSDVADLKHMGDRWGGSITAALFLREFVGDTPFIHCDIAGPALADKQFGFYTKGGTGHGVLTLLRFIETM